MRVRSPPRASTEPRAATRATNGDIDLVLTDIAMPAMIGREPFTAENLAIQVRKVGDAAV
ncbi:MAG: hypothetical protein M3P26_01230 [Gemmatimonadota bacterium]|nr:hypothetical protein [Gemmatimonadota bacterium]